MQVSSTRRRNGRRWACSLSNVRGVEKTDRSLALAILALIAMAVWSSWSTLVVLFGAWQSNGDYSVGQLVPLLAVYLVWRDRRALSQCNLVPCWWGGVALLLFAEVVSICGILSLRLSLERYALVLTIVGLVLLVAGREIFRRVIWIFPFLLLMAPLPGQLQSRISQPLQRLATTASVFLLGAISPGVAQEGNIVVLREDIRLAVAEACSGLRMLTAFIVVAAVGAYMVKRSRWHKAALLAMSIPIAVLCNVLRIVVTGVLVLYVSEELAEKFFHDLAGVFMMPVAVSLLFTGLRLIDRLVAPETATQEKHVVVRARSTKVASPKRLPA